MLAEISKQNVSEVPARLLECRSTKLSKHFFLSSIGGDEKQLHLFVVDTARQVEQTQHSGIGRSAFLHFKCAHDVILGRSQPKDVDQTDRLSNVFR